MGSRRSLARIGVILVLTAGIPSRGYGQSSAPPDSVMTVLLDAMRSSPCIQTFELGGGSKVVDKTAPNIAGFRVIALGPVPAASDIDRLRQLLRQASEATCALPKPCEYDPRYGFRFVDSKPPLDVLVEGCGDVLFFRQDMLIKHVVYCDDAVTAAVRELVRSVFQKQGTKDQANSVLQPSAPREGNR